MVAVWPTEPLDFGHLVSDDDWNQHVDNLNDLNTRLTSVESLTSNATWGNSALNDRLITVENTNTSQTGQINSLTTRMNTAESNINALQSGNGVFAKYTQTTSQTGIPATTWTAMVFQQITNSNPYVTRNGAQNQFTLTKPGRWYVLATVAVSGTSPQPPVGTKNLMLASGPGASYGTIYAINSGYAELSGRGMYVQTSSILVVNTTATVCANVYSYGGALDLTQGGSPNIQFVYLGA